MNKNKKGGERRERKKKRIVINEKGLATLARLVAFLI
jgi:hypothetical protein